MLRSLPVRSSSTRSSIGLASCTSSMNMCETRIGFASPSTIGPRTACQTRRSSAGSSASRRGSSPSRSPFVAHARLAHAPLVHLIELPRPEIGDPGERLGEPRAVGRELVPRRDERAGHAAELVPEPLERAARHLRQPAGRPRAVERRACRRATCASAVHARIDRHVRAVFGAVARHAATTRIPFRPARHRLADPRVDLAGDARGDRVDRVEHRGMALRARDDRRRVLGDAGRQLREEIGQDALGPARERRHRNVVDAERRKDAPGVVEERLVRHDDHHAIGPKTLRIGVREVRDAMEPHRGLAAARAPLDDDEPGAGLGDDRRTAPGRASTRSPAGADPRAAARPARGRSAGAFASGESFAERAPIARPTPVPAAHERPRRARHALQLAVRDRDGAPREHLALDDPARRAPPRSRPPRGTDRKSCSPARAASRRCACPAVLDPTSAAR